ncbi:MAG: aminodeoxychorismate lyase [Corynebacterium sp.]|nr:aminodeoxychorismate lyase [Corynebacterium sp.]
MSRDPVIIIVEPYGGSARRQMPQMPHIYWDDLGVTRGDGIFESILIHAGHACNLAAHHQRFARSAAARDLPNGVDAIRAATQLAIDTWVEHCHGEHVDAKMVWTLTRGRPSTGHPTAWITVTELGESAAAQEKGVKVLLAGKGFTLHPEVAPWATEAAKTLGYAATLAALRAAHAHGLDDVIWVDGDRVLEGSTSSVVTVKGMKIRTPKPGIDVLPGTTQQAIFDVCGEAGYRCSERDLTVAILQEADSVWLVSSTRGPIPVRALADGRSGLPVANRKQELELTKLRPEIDPKLTELFWSALHRR